MTLMNTQNKNKKQIIYPELSYKITGLLFDAHNRLGRFCREKQYCDELEKLLKDNEFQHRRELIDDSSNRLDFLVEDKIILEIKAKNIITKEDYYQLSRYLELNNIKLGIIVNFRNRYLKPKRIINSKYS